MARVLSNENISLIAFTAVNNTLWEQLVTLFQPCSFARGRLFSYSKTMLLRMGTRRIFATYDNSNLSAILSCLKKEERRCCTNPLKFPSPSAQTRDAEAACEVARPLRNSWHLKEIDVLLDWEVQSDSAKGHSIVLSQIFPCWPRSSSDFDPTRPKAQKGCCKVLKRSFGSSTTIQQ